MLLHQGDEMLWRMIYPGTEPDENLGDDQVIEIAATPLRVLHTPGHSPGSVCLYAPALGTVFFDKAGALMSSVPAAATLVFGIGAAILAVAWAVAFTMSKHAKEAEGH